MKFKSGDRVWVIVNGETLFSGEITIVREITKEYKVLPDGPYDYNYDYWNEENLELYDIIRNS